MEVTNSMPELGFYFDDSDLNDFAKRCLTEGAYFVPDHIYTDEKFDKITTFSKFRECRINGTNLFFILHNSYEDCPFELRPIVKNEVTGFYILQKNGGPTIDLFCPSSFDKNGTDVIAPGFVAFHSSYWNTTTREEVRAPESIKLWYRMLTKTIKERSMKIRARHRIFMVGQGATARLAEGWQLGGVFAQS